MRKQYYFQPSSRGLLAWDVDRLIERSRDFPRRRIEITSIRELDEPWFGDDERPTWRSLVEHVKLMDEADLSFPIILSADGRVMDGRHRAAQALRLGLHEVQAVQFDVDPPPDYSGRSPDELPYEPEA
jgi:hypothetical protein